MCKYEMDPMSIVEDTERTRFCPQTDKVKPVFSAANLALAGFPLTNAVGENLPSHN